MKIKLIFSDNNGKNNDVDFLLNDSDIARRWFNKIKHLQFIKHSLIETSSQTPIDIEFAHKEFCNAVGLQFKKLEYSNQEHLNYLHEIYEKYHSHVSYKEHNEKLYRFHIAIHHIDRKEYFESFYDIGWGIKEGPLTKKFVCNQFYENKIEKNNIYLLWSELGKKPKFYFDSKEPNNLDRFMELVYPHITFRAKFSIARKNVIIRNFNKDFIHWFENYKTPWLKKYKLDNWQEKDEQSGILLAIPKNKDISMNNFLQEFPTFQKIEL
jgi:hypothetical protein